MNIKLLKDKVKADQFEFSKHDVDQSIIRGISVKEVKDVISEGKLLEDYSEDKYGPSC